MIKSVEIVNFCGIESVKFDCKKFNIFSGDNLQGKTTVLEAIKWCFVGGDDSSLVRNGAATAEVILISDNGTRIERRLSRGGKSKLFAYKNDQPIENPQKVLSKLYHPALFSPTDLLRMKPKELNEFISDCISKRLKLTPDQIKEYGLENLDLTEDPVAAINGYHKTIYDQRTEVGRSLKTLEAKASNVIEKVSEEDIANLTAEVAELNKKLDSSKDHNSKVEIGKRNAAVKKQTEESIATLESEINSVDGSESLASLKEKLSAKEKESEALKSEVTKLRANHSQLSDALKKIDSGIVTCPLHGDIKCTTDMSGYKTTISERLEALVKEGKPKFDQVQAMDAEIENIKKQITSMETVENKKLQLERMKGMLSQIELVDGEPIDIAVLQQELNDKNERLTKMKVGLEMSKASGLDDVRKRHAELDAQVAKLNTLINSVIPGLLTLNVPGVTMTKEGLFFKGVPIRREGDSLKLRVCAAILKDLFPASNIYNLDRLECIAPDALKKYVDTYSDQKNGIQYFGSYVGQLNFAPHPNCKIFVMKGFKLV